VTDPFQDYLAMAPERRQLRAWAAELGAKAKLYASFALASDEQIASYFRRGGQLPTWPPDPIFKALSQHVWLVYLESLYVIPQRGLTMESLP
jgi:hypothetical protein